MTEAAIAELIEAAVRQLREEKDAAVEALVAMITDVRADAAVMAARLDRVDPPENELPGYCSCEKPPPAHAATPPSRPPVGRCRAGKRR